MQRKELRKHPRTPVPIPALIKNKQFVLSASTRNLSLGGTLLYAKCGISDKLRVHQELSCQLMLHALSFDMVAKVKRREECYIALEFSTVKNEKLLYLQGILEEYVESTQYVFQKDEYEKRRSLQIH